jgi:tripartite-type tricarboxylate transporter receptor subunit TctC
MDVKNQAAIVTGGASGLGAASARALAAAGAKVAVADINEKAAAEVAKEIGGVAVACDVSDSASAEAAIKKASDAHGTARVLVTCAGIGPAKRIVGHDGPMPLAAASAERNPIVPDVPTFGELGIKGMEISLWYGLEGPAGLPPAVVQRLNAELVKILKTDDLHHSFAKQGAVASGGTPAEFADFMRAESARWGEVVRKNGIKIQ